MPSPTRGEGTVTRTAPVANSISSIQLAAQIAGQDEAFVEPAVEQRSDIDPAVRHPRDQIALTGIARLLRPEPALLREVAHLNRSDRHCPVSGCAPILCGLCRAASLKVVSPSQNFLHRVDTLRHATAP